MAFLVCGPLGMDTISRALEGFEWITPDHPAPYPEGWAADPAAFSSGLDLSRADSARNPRSPPFGGGHPSSASTTLATRSRTSPTSILSSSSPK